MLLTVKLDMGSCSVLVVADIGGCSLCNRLVGHLVCRSESQKCSIGIKVVAKGCLGSIDIPSRWD